MNIKPCSMKNVKFSCTCTYMYAVIDATGVANVQL